LSDDQKKPITDASKKLTDAIAEVKKLAKKTVGVVKDDDDDKGSKDDKDDKGEKGGKGDKGNDDESEKKRKEELTDLKKMIDASNKMNSE